MFYLLYLQCLYFLYLHILLFRVSFLPCLCKSMLSLLVSLCLSFMCCWIHFKLFCLSNTMWCDNIPRNLYKYLLKLHFKLLSLFRFFHMHFMLYWLFIFKQQYMLLRINLWRWKLFSFNGYQWIISPKAVWWHEYHQWRWMFFQLCCRKWIHLRIQLSITKECLLKDQYQQRFYSESIEQLEKQQSYCQSQFHVTTGSVFDTLVVASTESRYFLVDIYSLNFRLLLQSELEQRKYWADLDIYPQSFCKELDIHNLF